MRQLIDLIINTEDKEFVHEGLTAPTGSVSEAVEYVIAAAQTMYPKWTSMVVTIAREAQLPE